MYWHYVRHGLKPSEYYQMGYGERLVLRAFMEQEYQEIKEEEEAIKRKAKGGM